MLIDTVIVSRSAQALSCAAILTVAGCVMGPDNDPGLASAIRAHYAAHATEEEGACRSPKIDTIQEHRVVARSADDSEVVMVRYSYFDRHADMDANWDRLVHLSQPCGGIAERRFVLARGALGYRVTDMGGEHRNGESKH
ncbi:MAG: hypothetical protein ACR2P3_05535 [Geminicoccaceae bacterium]